MKTNKTDIQLLFNKLENKHFRDFVDFIKGNWKSSTKKECLVVTMYVQFEHKDRKGKILNQKVGKLQFKVE